MKKKIDLKEINAVLNVLNMESLNTLVMDEVGNTVEAMDLLGNDDEAKLSRLKTLLISVCTSTIQVQVVELLSQQYTVADIAKELGYNTEYIRRLIREIRKKCQKLLKKQS